MNLPEEILTKRLRLRPPVESDAANVFERYAHDPRVCKYLSWTPHTCLEDTHEYLKRCVSKESPDSIAGYLIFAQDSGQLLGSVGGSVQAARMQFGYCFAHDVWGHGYATEAVGAFVAAVMAEPTVWRIQAYCDVENRASAHVLEKIGLTFEGTLRRYMVLPNLGDVPRDVHCYAKVKT
jgi:[ribosomal protein S5]-alanine N-acetyltransferase